MRFFFAVILSSTMLQGNTAAKGEFIGVVTDATHNNVKNNICRDNNPKCRGM